MLNKEICLRCYKKELPSHFSAVEKRFEIAVFNKYWRKRYVPCPFYDGEDWNTSGYFSGLYFGWERKRGPPDNCPYILEQTLSKGKKYVK